MKGYIAFLAVASYFAICTQGSLHASCKIEWTWAVNCTTVKNAILKQISIWTSDDNCKHGGEKCLYTLKKVTEDQIFATHTTPVRHFVDDLTFTFKSNGSELCNVEGYSTSEIPIAVLDFGTNYCNLHNLITGAGLDKFPKYSEKTNDHLCTQYSSRNCDKYWNKEGLRHCKVESYIKCVPQSPVRHICKTSFSMMHPSLENQRWILRAIVGLFFLSFFPILLGAFFLGAPEHNNSDPGASKELRNPLLFPCIIPKEHTLCLAFFVLSPC